MSKSVALRISYTLKKVIINNSYITLKKDKKAFVF